METKQAKAMAKTVRLSARKARLILDEIRGKDVEYVAAFLRHTPNKGAEIIGKVLKSAVANASNNHEMNADNLYVKECYANEGITMKRFKAGGKGSAAPRLKRTSHITVVVAERN